MKVIICDDDPIIRDSIRVCFEVSGREIETTEFEMGNETVEYARDNDADLMFLDMGLPDIDGLDVLRQVRKTSEMPVIVVSGNETTESVVKALAIGADDYITKPFEPIELIARVEAVIRRTSGRIAVRRTFAAPGILLDFDRKSATVNDALVDLNMTEWDVLKTLTDQPGVVVEFSVLKQSAWGNTDVTDAAVHMAVRRLRQKLQQDAPGSGEGEGLIRSHRGIGYSVSAS